MKLPKYMEIVAEKPGRKPTVMYLVRIKRWGIPIIFFKAMRQIEEVRWHDWITVFPAACVKAMRRGFADAH